MRKSRFTEQQIAFALRQAETGTKESFKQKLQKKGPVVNPSPIRSLRNMREIVYRS
jgi:hypothetical protein